MLTRDNWHLSRADRTKKLQSEVLALLNAMSPEARLAVESEVMPQLSENFYANLLNGVYEAGYERKPVDVVTFATSNEYLGQVLKGNIFPALLDDLEQLFEGGYTEVLLKGAIGWGKTTMAYIGIAYDLYLVSCLKSPGDAFGLLPGSNVAFINVSVNKTQARKILFGGLLNLMRQSPYFNDVFPYDARITSEARFPKGVFCYPVAGNEQSLLGEGVFSAAFDEMNFYAVVEHSKMSSDGGTYDQAVALYDRMSRRLKSRMNQRGRLPGHIWMISSARYPTDFTERKALEARTDPHIFVRDYAAWETRPRHYFMSESFHVEVGDMTRRSRVLIGGEADVVQDRVIEVPKDFESEFIKDPDGAVRDFAGISVLTIRPFIGRRDLILKIFQNGEAAGLQHPYSQLEVTMQSEMDYLIPEKLHWYNKETIERGVSRIEHKLFPALRYVHIDLAKSGDACGFAMVHGTDSVKVSRGIAGLETIRMEEHPIIRCELALRIVAPKNGEILAPLVRGLIYQLHQVGIQFGRISYDGWGSHESIQILDAQGFNVEQLSLDKDEEGYETFKTAIYDERFLCYPFPFLQTEIIQLEKNEKTRKIDHPPNGSKDVADAVAGAVFNCEQGFHLGVAESLAPSKNPPKNLNDDVWSRLARGEQISEAEFDAL